MKSRLLMFIAILVAVCAWTTTVQAEDGTDVTETYLTNPSFEGTFEVFARPNADRTIDKPEGWTVTYTSGDANDFGNVGSTFVQDGVTWNAKSGSSYFIRQRWSANSTIGLSQEVKELAAGTYELKAAISNHVESGKLSTAKIYVKVGSQTYETLATASTATAESWNDYTVKFTIYEQTDVTIGLSSYHTSGTFKTAYDNFTLTQYEIDVDEAIVVLTAKKVEAETLIASTPKGQTTVLAALSTAIAEVDAAITEGTSEAVAAMITKLNKAMDAANESISAYTSLEELLTAANANKANYADYPGLSAFETAIGTAQGIYDAATSDVTAVTQAVATLEAAEKTCRLTQPLPADFTWIIENPDANNGYNGWTTTGVVKTPPSGEHWLGKEPANPYFDGGNWDGTGWTSTMSQSINGLPAGKYILKAVARASDQVTLTLAAKAGSSTQSTVCPAVNATAGAIWEAAEADSPEKKANDGKGYGWANNSVTIEILKGEDLVINFTATTAGNHQWFSVDQFELEYVSTDQNVAPTAPTTPAFTVPEQTKPLESGEYVIYHTASQKFLTSTGGGPVAANYGYTKVANAYAFDVTVSNEVKDTITMKQLSSKKFVNTSTSDNWSMLYGDYTAGVSKFLIKGVETGYNIASLSSRAGTGKALGMNDGATGDVISLYYDKGTAANIVFQFIKKEDFYTQDVLDYEAELVTYESKVAVYNAKVTLMAELSRANTLVAAHPGDYSVEATTVYETVVNAARGAYLNEEATLEEVKEATASIAPALNAYLMSIITADEENPVDVSFAIINGDFSQLATGWNGAVGTATGGSTNVYEMYQKSDFDMNQILKGLPAGYYQLAAQGFARATVNDKGVAYAAGTENIKSYLYAKAGDTKTEIKWVSLYSETNTGTAENMGFYANSTTEANTAFVAGKYNNSTSNFFLNEGEDLTIGTYYDGTFATNSWTCYDNFKLIYKGNSLNILIKDLEAEIELAKAVTGAMQNSVATALADAITDAEEAVEAEPAVKEDLEAAQTQLAEAVTAAKASIAVYAKLPAAIEEAEASSVAEEPAVVAAINTANEVYTTAEVDADGIAEAIKALKVAVNTQIAAGFTGNDYTALIVNPTIIQKGGIQSKPWGWEDSSNSGTNGNFSKEAGTEEAPKDTYLEAWNSNAATMVFDYNQTIILPNGIYQVGAATFTEVTNGNAVLYGNDVNTPMLVGAGFPTGVGNEKKEINTSLAVTVTNNELRIGIKTIGTLDKSWSGADFFTLTYLGADLDDLKVELNDSLTVATGLKTTASDFIVKAEMNKLEAAITEGNEAKTSEVLDEVYDAIGSLKTAITAARTSIGLCAALAELFQKATGLIEEYGDVVDPSALQTVLDKNLEIYQNQTDETDNAAILVAKAEMEAALAAYEKDIEDVGVNDVNADDVKVYVNGSSIVVEGADNYKIYTQGGILIANDAQLLPGIYIVEIAGQTVKIAVK